MKNYWSNLTRQSWLMALPLLFGMVYGAAAVAAQTPSYTASTSGTTNNLTLTANLNVADADAGNHGNVYLGYNFLNDWYFHNGNGWARFNGGVYPVYAAAPLANRTIEVVRDADLSSLIGGRLYVGYGLNEKDMLSNGKYNAVYTVMADTTAPTVSDTVIANEATDVALNTAIGATFSETMNPASINTATVTLRQGNTPLAGVVHYSGGRVVFAPSSALSPGVRYTAAIKGGANGVKDLAGNALLSDHVWSWTTSTPPVIADTSAPTVGRTSVTNGATGVAVDTPIGVVFSEAMNPASLTGATVTLQQGTTLIPGTLSYSNGRVVFTPTHSLLAATRYTATVKGGSNGALDLAGNALAADYVWSWTTAAAPVTVDTIAPLVSGTAIANVSTGVAIDATVGAVFDKAMNPATLTTATVTLMQGATPVTGTVSYSGGIMVFTPSKPLVGGAGYLATIKGGSNGVKDLAGNAMVGDYVWSWTTAGSTSRLHPVLLGTAGNFAILAKTGISTVPTSIITGDIGVSPVAATYLTGFSLSADASNVFSTSPQVVGGGRIYAANYAVPTPSNLTVAVLDMQTAYTDAAGRPTPDFLNLGAGTIGGLTLAPGLYKWGSSVMITTDVTISGSANDVWIFQMSGDLIMSAAKRIILSGGALAKNIFWQVAGQATIGTTAHFEGNILSQTGITLQTGATMNGRALAQSLVALQSATVTKPAP
jgi:hypothetical protein